MLAQRARDLGNDSGPVAGTALVKQSRARVPVTVAAAGRPPPVAVRVQHDPCFAAERAGQMGDHGIDRDDQIERTKPVRELIDVSRADVDSTDLCNLLRRNAALEREGGNARDDQLADETCGQLTPLVPVADPPHEPN